MSSRDSRHGTRYKARARAVDLIFEAEQRDADPLEVTATHVELSREDGSAPVRPYTHDIIEGIAVEMDSIDDAIQAHLADGWKLNNLPAVDRAILRVCAWELLFNPEVPTKVTCKEGAELGLQYSGPDAGQYINAVLDSIAKERAADSAPTASDETTDSTPEIK
ncbi:MAG: transcription antitermination factor NusB [Corynebacterium sp.]|nr:transcription antitermination factor NusB [Corynebacterium sp.]